MSASRAVVLVICTSLLAAAILLAACQTRRRGDSTIRPPAAPIPFVETRVSEPIPTIRPAPTVTPVPQPGPKALPTLDREPVIDVLIARAPSVEIQVLRPANLNGQAIPTGRLVVEGRAGSWRVAGGQPQAADGRLTAGDGGPAFAVDAIPVFGAKVQLKLGGELVIHPVGGEVEIIERLPMERYLVSVVGKEMNATWPEKALAAQAVVARSYACARWMERTGESWQLHWHFGVDMAYAGWQQDARVSAAVASTRGEVLMYRGFPVLALFHASSGGRTEDFSVVKPKVLAPDGRTPIAAAMPVVDDPAAIPGAEGLKLAASHARWKLDMPLPEVTTALQAWSAKSSRDRPAFGTIEVVSVATRQGDSGRVATVSIRHRLDGKERFVTMPATDFRLAIGPGKLRSTWWDRCVIAAKAPGYLVIEGRGFGHGCGLSQVSAWFLATQGVQPEEIVARFYRGAAIERRY